MHSLSQFWVRSRLSFGYTFRLSATSSCLRRPEYVFETRWSGSSDRAAAKTNSFTILRRHYWNCGVYFISSSPRPSSFATVSRMNSECDMWWPQTRTCECNVNGLLMVYGRVLYCVAMQRATCRCRWNMYVANAICIRMLDERGHARDAPVPFAAASAIDDRMEIEARTATSLRVFLFVSNGSRQSTGKLNWPYRENRWTNHTNVVLSRPRLCAFYAQN